MTHTFNMPNQMCLAGHAMLKQVLLRIPDSCGAKKKEQKSANLPVIQLINHLFKIRQKDFF